MLEQYLRSFVRRPSTPGCGGYLLLSLLITRRCTKLRAPRLFTPTAASIHALTSWLRLTYLPYLMGSRTTPQRLRPSRPTCASSWMLLAASTGMTLIATVSTSASKLVSMFGFPPSIYPCRVSVASSDRRTGPFKILAEVNPVSFRLDLPPLLKTHPA